MDSNALEREIGFARDRLAWLEQRAAAAQTADDPTLLAATVSELSTIAERLRGLEEPRMTDEANGPATLETFHGVADAGGSEARTRVVNALFELFARKTSRKEYLDSVVGLICSWIGCHCVGVRIVNAHEEIPYESYVGFSDEYCLEQGEKELRTDACICVRIVTKVTRHWAAATMTPRGSFFCDEARACKERLPVGEQSLFCTKCAAAGFQSIAVVPLSYLGDTLGVLHLADERKGVIPLQSVEFVETLAPLIGEVIHRFDMEQTLRQNAERLRLFVEQIPAIFWFTDAQMRYTSCIGKGLTALGIAPDEFIGHKIWDLAADDAEALPIVTALQRALHGRPVTFEYGMRGRFYQAHAEPFRASDGRISGCVGVSLDITDRKQFEGRLLELHKEIAEVSAREQRSIGLELHDNLGQQLTGIGMLAKRLHMNLEAQSLPEAEKAAELAALVREAQRETRALSRGLMPVEVGVSGLATALEEIVARADEVSSATCRFQCSQTVAV
jgi:PAS domain S-box-containing protein